MAPRNWWVWEELNFRPHPYQGCALPNCATDPRPVPLRTKTICVSAPAPYRLLYSRKEVIQPQVPLRLPCYDFTPVIDHTVVGAPLAVRLPASGTANSHGVTGGVFLVWVRFLCGVLFCVFLCFRLHGVELQTPIRTTTGFLGLAPPRGLATLCTGHCSTCVALPIRAMMT